LGPDFTAEPDFEGNALRKSARISSLGIPGSAALEDHVPKHDLAWIRDSDAKIGGGLDIEGSPALVGQGFQVEVGARFYDLGPADAVHRDGVSGDVDRLVRDHVFGVLVERAAVGHQLEAIEDAEAEAAPQHV